MEPIRKLELVGHNDPILRKIGQDFDFGNYPFDPLEFAKLLTEKMLELNGLGLSACQVGYDYRIFAVKTNPITVAFNPKIVDVSDETVLLEEGCLSFPQLVVKIKRPKSIRIRYTLPNGETDTHKYTGITARAFQHEYDHTNGVLFFNRANKFHRDQAYRQRDKRLRFIEARKKQEALNPPPKPLPEITVVRAAG